MLPDLWCVQKQKTDGLRLNAPTGAWCSLTHLTTNWVIVCPESQCTYRCVVLPDRVVDATPGAGRGLNAPTGAWCSLTFTIGDVVNNSTAVSMHLQVRGAP